MRGFARHWTGKRHYENHYEGQYKKHYQETLDPASSCRETKKQGFRYQLLAIS